MTEPSDPTKLAKYHMFQGAAIALTSMHNSLSDLQVFHIERIWPVSSSEFKAVADTMEALKNLVAKRQQEVIDAAKELLE